MHLKFILVWAFFPTEHIIAIWYWQELCLILFRIKQLLLNYDEDISIAKISYSTMRKFHWCIFYLLNIPLISTIPFCSGNSILIDPDNNIHQHVINLCSYTYVTRQFIKSNLHVALQLYSTCNYNIYNSLPYWYLNWWKLNEFTDVGIQFLITSGYRASWLGGGIQVYGLWLVNTNPTQLWDHIPPWTGKIYVLGRCPTGL